MDAVPAVAFAPILVFCASPVLIGAGRAGEDFRTSEYDGLRRTLPSAGLAPPTGFVDISRRMLALSRLAGRRLGQTRTVSLYFNRYDSACKWLSRFYKSLYTISTVLAKAPHRSGPRRWFGSKGSGRRQRRSFSCPERSMVLAYGRRWCSGKKCGERWLYACRVVYEVWRDVGTLEIRP